MPNWLEIKSNPRLRAIYDKRMEIHRLIREFFWSNDFKEVDTPIAVRYPGQEPNLCPVPVLFHEPFGKEHRLYLHTSPELAMKKLLASGYERIFQLCKCFRDFEQFGGNHNTEFTMIEWYRAPGTIEDIMDDTERLFKYVGKNLGVGKLIREIGDKQYEIDLAGKWERLSMRQVWKKYLGIDLNDYLTAEKMLELARQKGYNIADSEPYEDLFFKIFLNEIEQKLGLERPLIIYDYPEQMTSLSRLSKSDRRYAERFELYVGGLELANAFGELTDAVEQNKRLEADRAKRMMAHKDIWPVDQGFISALKSGVPEAGGIAMGVDRMIMLFTEAKNINEVIFQSVADMVDSDQNIS